MYPRHRQNYDCKTIGLLLRPIKRAKNIICRLCVNHAEDSCAFLATPWKWTRPICSASAALDTPHAVLVEFAPKCFLSLSPPRAPTVVVSIFIPPASCFSVSALVVYIFSAFSSSGRARSHLRNAFDRHVSLALPENHLRQR